MDWGSVKTGALAVVILAAIVLSERVTHQPVAPGPVHVVYWEKWTDFEGQAMRDVVDAFNKSQTKIHVDLLTISGIQDKTLMAVAGNIPPDIAGLFGPDVAQYADDQAILPLDDYCAKAGIKREDYIDIFYDIGFYQGHTYALPSVPASVALHFNKDMLAEVGIQNPPETIEELNADSIKLTKKGTNGTIIKQGFLPAEPGWWNWAWGYFFGGALWDGKDKITANSKENIRAFEWIQWFSTQFGSGELQTFRSGFGNFSSPQNAFLSKKVAMEIQGVWMYNFIDKFSPDLKWGAVPFPYPKDHPELKGITIADEDILCIPRGAKHPDEAFEFIKFVQSQKGMEMLCMGQRKNSPLKKVSPEFYAKHPNPFIHLFTDLPKGPHTISTPKIGIWPEYNDELIAAFDEVVLKSKTPKQALDDVQAHMQPKLDEYLLRLKQRGKSLQ